ncbi:MAG: DEAD/DEAH box helicase [Nitrospiraceae bacterium]
MIDVLSAYQAAGITEPFSFQRHAWQRIAKGCNIIISAGTGSGKTEAAFLPALATGRRIIALYPTKALLQDQLSRIGHLAVGNTIAVDTGDEDDRSFYRADVILTSLDKFLYRFFGYGKKRWSYLYPYRIGFDDTRGTMLILDEAHAYEEVAFSHFWFMLKKLTYERSIQTVLLSATLPPALIGALQDVDRNYFPRATDEGLFFEKVADDGFRPGRLLYAGHLSATGLVKKAIDTFDRGKRVIIALDAVVPPRDTERANGRTLHEVWKRLVHDVEARDRGRSSRATVAQVDGAGRVRGNILTYHGHQMSEYRKEVLQRLKELDEGWKPNADGSLKKGEPFILVTTSAMEIGVDISSDVMITDLCECDSFVQRIGRCARRPGESGEVYLINDDGGQRRRGRALWEAFKGRAVGSLIDAEAKQHLNEHNAIPDLNRIHLRLEYLQDQSLYRYVYDFVQENQELWEKGVVITREWEPSIALVHSEQRDGKDYIAGIPARDFWRAKELKEKLLLPLSGAADIAPYCAWVFEGYNDANQYTQRVAVGGANDRTLIEALRLAGVSARSRKQDENKVQPIYALGLPLILILGSRREGTEVEHDNTWPYEDPNIGLCYLPRFGKLDQEPKVFSPSPQLRVRKVFLRKENRRYELPLYWFEPNDEDQSVEAGTP